MGADVKLAPVNSDRVKSLKNFNSTMAHTVAGAQEQKLSAWCSLRCRFTEHP